MKPVPICLLIALLAIAAWTATPATEVWQGTRTAAGKSQSLVLRVDRSDDPPKATVDLPDSGALDLPAVGFSLADGKVRFELIGDTSNAVFDGRLVGEVIRGDWREGDRVGAFRLRRGPETRPRLIEQAVSFRNGNVRLRGTLLLPEAHEPVPAIVFVHGAGPETRSASRFLAQFFVAHGVAALIYDKRGTGESTGEWARASFDDLAGDVVAAVNYLKTRREVDRARLGLMGSGQGCWVAPLAAVRSPDVRFVIAKSMAGVTPERQELARVGMQMKANGNPQAEIDEALALYRQVIAYARTGHRWDDLSAALQAASQKSWYDFGEVPRDWWFFGFIKLNFACDPIPTVQRLKVPLLVILGEEDTIVPVQASLARLTPALREAPKGTLIRVFPKAGHDLRVAPAKGEPWDFSRFAPGYLDLLASWVSQQTGQPAAGPADHRP